ncbi:MAG: YCF48-related protein, partial [Candidatus Margulisiibacteriota bacterium]
MMRLLAILFVGIVVLQGGAFAAGWTAQSSGTTDVIALSDIYYYSNASTSFAVTAGNTDFFKSYDAGTTWVKKPTGLTAQIDANAVQFTSPQIGYIGGTNNLLSTSFVLKSTDGGETWSANIGPGVLDGADKAINDISFISDTVGWACGVGGASTDWPVSKTTDGGTTWTNANVSGDLPMGTYNGIQFVDAINGWVVGTAGKLYATANGGTGWIQQASGLTANNLVSIFFLNSTTGWVLSDAGDVLKYTSGSWSAVRTGAEAGYKSIWFADANNGWIVGTAGKVYATTNGGTTWTAQTSGTTRDLNAVYGITAVDLWAVGGDAINPATIIKYGDNPTITSTSVSSLGAGAQSQTITIIGTNYKDSTLLINTAGTTGITYSATRTGDTWTITITIDPAFTPATGATVPITITTPGGGTVSTNLQINSKPDITRVFRHNTKLGDVSWDRLGATSRTLTIDGHNFQAGAVVTWSKGGSATGIVVSNSTNISATMETCVISVDKNAATLGTWEVKLTNPDKGVATGEFTILTDSEGPVVDPFKIDGSATTKILSSMNPAFTGTLTDITHGMATADANIKLFISSGSTVGTYEYYYEPKNTDLFALTSTTAGDFKFTMGNVIDVSTNLPVDLYNKVGTTSWYATLYCEDAEGNPTWAPYPNNPISFPSQIMSGNGLVVWPNPVTTLAPIKVQYYSTNYAGPARFYMYSMDGGDKIQVPVNVNLG